MGHKTTYRSAALLRTARPASSATSTTECASCVVRCSTRAALTHTAEPVSSAAPGAASQRFSGAHAVSVVNVLRTAFYNELEL